MTDVSQVAKSIEAKSVEAEGTKAAATKADEIAAALALIDRYLDTLIVERKLSDHTLAAYRRDLLALSRMAQTTLPHKALIALEHHHIRRLTAQLNARGLAARSIARALSAWRTFYQWLAGQDLIKVNPVVDVHAPRPAKRLPKALSQDQAIQLVSNASLDATHALPFVRRDAAMFELFYSSGLRLNEVVMLDCVYTKTGAYKSSGWVDFQNAEVTVTGKGDKQRVVPVGNAALVALQAWLEVRDGFIKRGVGSRTGNKADVDLEADADAESVTAEPLAADTSQPLENTQPALFISERGTRLSGRSIELRLKAHAQRLGIPAKVHPHVLRHSFASHVLQASGDLRAVQEMLGHASIAATQVYTSLDFQHLAQVYDAAHPRARKK